MWPSSRKQSKRSKRSNPRQAKQHEKLQEIGSWNTEKVCEWLVIVRDGLWAKHEPKFRKAKIDGRKLLSMTRKDIAKLGVDFRIADDLFRTISTIHITEEETFGKEAIRVGDLVVLYDHRMGHVKYIGSVQGKSGSFLGIDLIAGDGRNDGTIKGVEYFKTSGSGKTGVFIRRKMVMQVGSFSNAKHGDFELDTVSENVTSDSHFDPSEISTSAGHSFQNSEINEDIVGDAVFVLDHELSPATLTKVEGESRQTKTWAVPDSTARMIKKYESDEQLLDSDLKQELDDDPILWSLARERRETISDVGSVATTLHDLERAINLIEKYIPEMTELMKEEHIGTDIYKTNVIQELLKRVQQKNMSHKIRNNFQKVKAVELDNQFAYTEEDVRKMERLMAWVRNNVTASCLTDENDAQTALMGLQEVKQVLLDTLMQHHERHGSAKGDFSVEPDPSTKGIVDLFRS